LSCYFTLTCILFWFINLQFITVYITNKWNEMKISKFGYRFKIKISKYGFKIRISKYWMFWTGSRDSRVSQISQSRLLLNMTDRWQRQSLRFCAWKSGTVKVVPRVVHHPTSSRRHRINVPQVYLVSSISGSFIFLLLNLIIKIYF